MKTNKDLKIKIPVNYISQKKRGNVAKHLRIAKATTGEEKQRHLEIADKLLTRYGL